MKKTTQVQKKNLIPLSKLTLVSQRTEFWWVMGSRLSSTFLRLTCCHRLRWQFHQLNQFFSHRRNRTLLIFFNCEKRALLKNNMWSIFRSKLIHRLLLTINRTWCCLERKLQMQQSALDISWPQWAITTIKRFLWIESHLITDDLIIKRTRQLPIIRWKECQGVDDQDQLLHLIQVEWKFEKT